MVHDKAISIQVSAGELIDKITILEIKFQQLDDDARRGRVQEELAMLESVRDGALDPSPQLVELTRQLKSVNAGLWHIEDAIRLCEQKKEFGPQFVELARSVYRNNDRRSRLKREINELVGSRLAEEKSYTPYA